MSKIWVVHIRCGSGHTKAAEAVHNVLAEKFDPELLNLADSSARIFKYFYESGYSLLVRCFPQVWFLIYRVFAIKLFSQILLWQNRLIFRRFIKSIIKENPDVLISTHFFVSQIAAGLKRKGLIDSKLITVITDYGVHRLWINNPTDFYITASQDVADEFKKKHAINPEKIKAFGLPLRQEFYKLPDTGLRKRYQEPDNITTVLLFSGGLGIGPFKLLIDKLYKKCGLLVVYGKNKGIESYIKRIENPVYLKGFEYKEEIWELMGLADFVVTKAGGLSVSECIAFKKPMVFMSAVPGQEYYNIDFVVQNKLGFYPGNNQKLIETIEWLVSNPENIEALNRNFDKVAVQNSPLLIRELVCSIVSNTSRRESRKGPSDPRDK